jgi:hypothetical protein
VTPLHAIVTATTRNVACSVRDEVVMLHLDQGVYYGLNPVGAAVWQLIQEPRRLGDIVDALTREFDVDRERCVCDVQELIDALVERQLVSVSTDETPG